MDDDHLTVLGNLLRRFTQGGERSLAHARQIEDYLQANFRGTDLDEDLTEPLATYRPEGGEHLHGEKDLDRIVTIALERISALSGGIGDAYLELIEQYLSGTITAQDLQQVYWPMRRKYLDRGMWFEGRLGTEIETYDSDVEAIHDLVAPISATEFRRRSENVAAELRRILGRNRA